MIVQPEVVVTPDNPTVKFKQGMEAVNLDAELPKVLKNQGWGAGTYFNVQFVEVGASDVKLISSRRYVVTEECEEISTKNPEGYNPMTSAQTVRKAEPLENWFITEYGQAKAKEEKAKQKAAKPASKAA